MTKGPVPLLVNCMTCAALVVVTGWEAKVTLAADRTIAGAVPIPDKATECGLPGALSVRINCPDLTPVAVGVNVTGSVQLPPGATELPQGSASIKSPVVVMLDRAAVPLLVSVT